MIDTIAIIELSRIERMTMLNADTSFLLLAEGRKTEAVEVSTHCGGGAVNVAVAMARLGLDVATIAKLGRDQRAETILAALMQEGVSTRWVGRDERAATGAAVMISSHDRNAAIFTFRGANTLLEDADLKSDAFAVDLIHVSSLSNQSADRVPRILAEAKRTGAFLIDQSRHPPAIQPWHDAAGSAKRYRPPRDQQGRGIGAGAGDRGAHRRRRPAALGRRR